jgi:hypothetical protein
MKVVLHIERVVVDGITLSPQAAAVLRETLRSELESRLGETSRAGEPGLDALRRNAGAHRVVVAEPLRLPPRATVGALAPAVAGALLHGLSGGAR